MKRINECFGNNRSLTERVMPSNAEINEGLKDWFKAIKDKFKEAYQYLKGVVARFGTYFVPVSKDGEVLPAISPLTAGAAYKEGKINKNTTLVCLNKEGQKITGCKTSPKDAVKLYGSGNSLDYWKRMLNESQSFGSENLINEVKLRSEDTEAVDNRIESSKELQQEIEFAIKHPDQAKLLIWGAPGIGKTAILNAVVEKMQKSFPDYQLIVKTLSNETPDNFTLPKYIQIEGQDFATDVPKTWLPVYKPTGDKARDKELDEATGRGLLFIDELSRATPQVLNVVLPLINEGVFNGYNVGSGWAIVCASNRMEDETSGQTDLGNALSNRFFQVYYEPTASSWLEWAKQQNYISPLLTQWLEMPETENMSGGKFFYWDPNEEADLDIPTKLMCTPRSWTNAMRRLASYSKTGELEGFTIFDLPERIIRRCLAGFIPGTAVSQFMAFLNIIQEIGDLQQVCDAIWQKGSYKMDKKTLQKCGLPLAQIICTAHAKQLPTAEEFEHLADWLIQQNSDQIASLVINVFKNVFAANIKSEDTRNSIFIWHLKKQAAKTNPKIAQYMDGWEMAVEPFVKTWGLGSSDNIPHWEIGLQKLAQKYAAAFSVQIDGKNALG